VAGPPINRVAVIGTGVIGSSWAACFLARGLDVIASDPAPGAEGCVHEPSAPMWAGGEHRLDEVSNAVAALHAMRPAKRTMVTLCGMIMA
jgi:3-hydroxyacyl-CoA dehydrogenase